MLYRITPNTPNQRPRRTARHARIAGSPNPPPAAGQVVDLLDDLTALIRAGLICEVRSGGQRRFAVADSLGGGR